MAHGPDDCAAAVAIPAGRTGKFRNENLLTARDLPSALAAASADYFRLVLLVGPPASGKSSQLRQFAHAGGHPLVAVGRAAAACLLELPERERQRRAAELVTDVVENAAAGANVILLDDIEVLFAPSLALDPLRLLQLLARNRLIVATWPGDFAVGALTYADAAHPEHRVYRDPEAVIVLAGSAPPNATS